MPQSLSSADLDRVTACCATLLTPLSAPDSVDWCSAVIGKLRDLVDSDTSSLMLRSADLSDIRSWMTDPRAVQAYAEYYHALDLGYTKRRRALGIEVWSTSMLWDPSELRRSEYWNDYKVPYRLFDAIGMAVEAGGDGSEAGVFLHRCDEGSPFGDRERRMLELTLPAFRAGARAHLRLARSRAALVRLLDSLVEGVLLVGVEGNVLHANRELLHTVASDPEGEMLMSQLRRMADAVCAVVRQTVRSRAGNGGAAGALAAIAHAVPRHTIATTHGRYRLTGSYVGESVLGSGEAVVAILERLTLPLRTREELRRRHRLTDREIDVTYLIAGGKSNADIRRELGISMHTAERHTEHVLMKLGVHSRTQVADAIRAD